MAGIAAYFGAKSGVTAAIAGGLVPRGDDVADWRGDGVELAVRAAIPQVHLGRYGTAVVLDGITEPTTVLARYADRGAAAVLGVPTPFGAADSEPYTLVLADPDHGTLVLARCGNGPTLYYAQRGEEVLVASEPAGLIAAGVPAGPDERAVREFLATGACDEGAGTFFAGIRQVLPGQVLEVSAAGVSVVPAARTPRGSGVASTSMAIQQAARYPGRVGVRMGGQIAGAALLGAALVSPDRADRFHPVPVYSATGPGPVPPEEHRYAEAVLAGLPDGTVGHKVLPVDAADLDDFLADLGEPVPDPTALLAWAAAREAAGEVDALLDPAGADRLLAGGSAPASLARLADRVTTRFGVALRLPFRHLPSEGEALRCELAALTRRGLPPEAARAADRRVPDDLTRGLLAALRADVYATFLSASFGARPWADAADTLAGFGDLLAGRGADADRYWRLFLLERWLLRLGVPGEPRRPRHRPDAVDPRGADPARPPRPAALAPNPGRELAITADGVCWLRFPVRTRVLGATDRFPDTVAWYIAELVAGASSDDRYRRRFGRSWYLVVAAKPLAVAQGRVRPLWDVRPGWWSRRLARFVRDQRDWTGLGNPWTMQLAIDEAGLRRLVFAAAAAGCARAVRRQGVFDRVAGPAVQAVSGPTEGAVYPTNVAVAAGPVAPERAAEEILAVTRSTLPAEAAGTLSGCAIVAAGRTGLRVLAAVGDRPASFFADVCADDPLGGRDARTPVAVVALAPPETPKRAHRKGRSGQRGK